MFEAGGKGETKTSAAPEEPVPLAAGRDRQSLEVAGH